MAVLFLIAAATLADASDRPPPPPPRTELITITGVKPREQRKVCLTDTPTGSIMPKRICKTASEWDAQRVASQSAIDQQARQEYQRQIDLFRRQQKRDGEN